MGSGGRRKPSVLGIVCRCGSTNYTCEWARHRKNGRTVRCRKCRDCGLSFKTVEVVLLSAPKTEQSLARLMRK